MADGYDLTFADLAKSVASGQSMGQINVWKDASQLNGGDFIVAGVDTTEGGASATIYHVPTAIGGPVNPTSKKQPFWAVGCGALHAIELLENWRYRSDWTLPSALYATYCAKRAAELSPGVDKEIDMRVISQNGIIPATDSLHASLTDEYEAEWTKRRQPDAYPRISKAALDLGL
ncbi:MAG: hypothetical protein ACLQVF_36000 [Isosphaeraceae bacterium]